MENEKNTSKSYGITIRLKPFFVYELIDPRDNKTFYVGKGSGKRDFSHKQGDKDLKEKKIREIEDSGHDVKRVIVGRYDTEDEAFSVETILIKWVYGYDNLTNIVPGKYNAFVREHYQKTRGEYTHITGIDREKTLNINSGFYTEELRRKIENNNIYEKLEAIYLYLNSELGSFLEIKEPNIDIPQDPHLLITGFSNHISIVLKLRLTGKDCTLALVPMSSKAKDKQLFIEEMANKFGEEAVLKNGNIYNSKYYLIKDENGNPETISHSNYQRIKHKLETLVNKVK